MKQLTLERLDVECRNTRILHDCFETDRLAVARWLNQSLILTRIIRHLAKRAHPEEDKAPLPGHAQIFVDLLGFEE